MDSKNASATILQAVGSSTMDASAATKISLPSCRAAWLPSAMTRTSQVSTASAQWWDRGIDQMTSHYQPCEWSLQSVPSRCSDGSLVCCQRIVHGGIEHVVWLGCIVWVVERARFLDHCSAYNDVCQWEPDGGRSELRLDGKPGSSWTAGNSTRWTRDGGGHGRSAGGAVETLMVCITVHNCST